MFSGLRRNHSLFRIVVATATGCMSLVVLLTTSAHHRAKTIRGGGVGGVRAYIGVTTQIPAEGQETQKLSGNLTQKHIIDTPTCLNTTRQHSVFPSNNYSPGGEVYSPGGVICGNPQRLQSAHIVVFTSATFAKESSDKWRNVEANWAQLHPSVVPVVFLVPHHTKDRQAACRACAQGWVVLWSPAWNQNGYPVLKDMYQVLERLLGQTMERPSRQWMGFANSDILFDASLHSALTFLDCALPQSNTSSRLLVTGRRRDIKVCTPRIIAVL